MPHRKSHVLADVAKGGPEHVQQAIDAAAEAHADWSRMPWHERAAVFLRAAELLSGPWRSTLNAATMLNQSKTAHQAEIDAVCEMCDFWRFNVDYMLRMYAEQPHSPTGIWNRLEYRPLEGFVLAVSPFNFTLHRREPLVARRRSWAAPSSGSRPRRPRSPPTIYMRAPAGGRSPGRGHQPRLRLRSDHREHRRSRARTSPASTSPARPRSSTACGRRSARTSTRARTTAIRGSSARPAARTSSSPTPPPRPTRSRRRSCAARSSTRARSAPPPRGSTSRRTSGPR